MQTDRESRAVVEAVVGLARSLGLRVLAEGVEDMGQYQCLRELGCDEAQGFLFSGALPAEAMAAWLREQ